MVDWFVLPAESPFKNQDEIKTFLYKQWIDYEQILIKVTCKGCTYIWGKNNPSNKVYVAKKKKTSGHIQTNTEYLKNSNSV